MNGKDRPRVIFEEIKVKGNQLVDKIREIIEEGNARRVIIKKDQRTLLEFPLSVGVGGATAAILLAPTLSAIAFVAALIKKDVNVIIERTRSTSSEMVHTPDATTPPPPAEPSTSEPSSEEWTTS